ncbi:hypothetical protein D7Z26_00210 [Cohnella endophytica]|uniref:Uncharacterized protein n=1 Tax=Cohnella endophytica TaxID=2419778 RepID=A0A494YD92_9BACL|nr:hypothetical protein [Cohnella endophytica]RKP57975.1 hypothetical protein D7Z26_00210 [Cohnella endophytica]
MFDTFKKSNVFAKITLVSGIIIFFLQLIYEHTFPMLGVITIIIGVVLQELISASKAELDKLRIENIDLRKKIDDLEKLKKHY